MVISIYLIGYDAACADIDHAADDDSHDVFDIMVGEGIAVHADSSDAYDINAQVDVRLHLFDDPFGRCGPRQWLF